MRNVAHRIERHHHGPGKGQRLQHVEQVVQAHAGGLSRRRRASFVVPGSPGQLFLRQDRRIGMQHCAVGLVADGAQHSLLGRAGRAQQGQRLVGVRGQHDLVKALGQAVGDHAHAACVALDQANRGVQALVANLADNFVHVVAGAALDRPPLWPVGDLQQPVVVAKPDHGGHGKLQHLLGRAGPDAAHHRQEVPVAEFV